MICVTGDCHGDYSRFITKAFKSQVSMNKNDFVIVAGDFGYWRDTKEQNYWLDWLEAKNFTTLWVDGNHENYDLLKKIEVDKWNGGKVQYIRPSVIHLMRGQVFAIDGCKIFTFGGARCHDIDGGILDLDDPDYKIKKRQLDRTTLNYRVNHSTWWKEEQPSEEEMNEGLRNLEIHQNQVDYIITHECAANTKALLDIHYDQEEYLSHYLQKIKELVQYKAWYFGHYHDDRAINNKEILVYEKISKIR